jgi:ABC-2 type transport system ATP-binding protein/lipopolysaccharide transport system ATP-binding protein
MASIKLNNVHVSFPIYDSRSRSLKRRVMSAVTGGRVRSESAGRITADASRVAVHALESVNLSIEHGSRVGLIGRNGVGKSTLLRVIGGIYMPEQGKVFADGRIALFGGSFGIDPELTGRENIELRGLYLGLSRSEIRAKLDEIIAFTELGPFIDMPFRTYSAGMRARLDFAVSTSVETDILLIDEGLGGGDASFLEKARRRLNSLTDAAGIVMLATHSENLLRKSCDQAVLMEAGRVIAVGLVDEVLRQYRDSYAA